MEDEKIIALYWNRNEDAITETSSKYGKLCYLVATNILSSREDSEECVNDTYLGLWNTIPVQRPSRFSVFATHQDLGQMQMYVNYYTRELMNEGDTPPIGIVLCADKSDAVVKYTLPEDNHQIFASKYFTYLPTEEELKRELRLDEFQKLDE